MKRYIILSCLAALFALTAFAQSTMTDEQIMQFVVKEHAAGTSNQQIVTQLMQRGVDIQQIRRVRNKYEREVKSKGLETFPPIRSLPTTVHGSATERRARIIQTSARPYLNIAYRTSPNRLARLSMTRPIPTGFSCSRK